MVGVKRKDRIRNTEIRGKTKARDCRYSIKKQKFDYAGHVVRKGDESWEKRVMEWYPREGKRSRGRPKTRWEDELIQNNGICWKRDALVRDRWKRAWEAYAQGWAH